MQGPGYTPAGLVAEHAGAGGVLGRAPGGGGTPAFLQASPEAMTIALLGQRMLPDGSLSPAHMPLQPAALMYAANALAMLQSMQCLPPEADAACRHPGTVCSHHYGQARFTPNGVGQLQAGSMLSSPQTARPPARHPTRKQDGEDLGPMVEVCGLSRREHGRRISAFNYFVKAMVSFISYGCVCSAKLALVDAR
jgi:hypothetical protein